MKKIILLTVFAVLLFTGCASKLSTVELQELKDYKEKELLVEEKSTTTAAWLGLLPGGGSFYTRSYWIGTANLLLWPYSILWDPFSGVNGAETINYEASKFHAEQEQDNDMLALKRKVEDKTISEEEYKVQKRAIEDKYHTEVL